MYQSALRLVAGVVLAAIGVYGSYTLILYSDRDDAPGGMVIGAVLMASSVLLGILISRGRAKQPHANGG